MGAILVRGLIKTFFLIDIVVSPNLMSLDWFTLSNDDRGADSSLINLNIFKTITCSQHFHLQLTRAP